MPIVTLYPDTTDGAPGAGDWPASSGDRHDAIDENDTKRISEGTNSTTITFTLDNFHTPLNFDTITSVHHSIHAYASGRPPTTISIKVEMLDGDDSDTSLYSNVHVVTVNGGESAQYDGTSRTTWNGSDAWDDPDYTKLNALKMKFTLVDNDIDGDGNPFDGNITWAYLTVTYTIIPTITYLSDDNVILKNGLIELKNGLTIIK